MGQMHKQAPGGKGNTLPIYKERKIQFYQLSGKYKLQHKIPFQTFLIGKMIK